MGADGSLFRDMPHESREMRSRERARRGHEVGNAGGNMRMMAKVTGWTGGIYVPQRARHGSYAYLAFWGHVYYGFDSAV